MIIVTKQDVLAFIERQPDVGRVDFGQTHMSDDCGCLMVQYARECLKDVAVDRCGLNAWLGTQLEPTIVAKFTDDLSYMTFQPYGSTRCSYADIKCHLGLSKEVA